jgi:ribonuclease R
MHTTIAPLGGARLRARAERAMADEGFSPAFPPDALAELRAIGRAPRPALPPGVRDARALLWSSVDNADSRDLDQLEVAERDGDAILLRVAIADVDAFVPAGSAIDRHAAQSTTSVYTGAAVFPMLPDPLSAGLTSLLPGEDRLAVVVELRVAPGGEVATRDIYRALVRNQARLDYEAVGAWLEGRTPLPKAVAAVAGLEVQLLLQHEAAGWLRALRERRGALELETIEARPVMSGEEVVGLEVPHKSAARYLIEALMVATNGAIAGRLEDSGSPSIQRVVRSPERWERIAAIAREYGDELPDEPSAAALSAFLERRRDADPLRFPDLSLSVVKLLGAGEYAVVRPGEQPEGHFGLATVDYTHATAPNRRYADLVTQRLLKAALAGDPTPYGEVELEAIAARCNERQSAARAVERVMRKVVAATLLAARVGDTFDGIVTGVSRKGTFVRLLAPPAEGRVLEGEEEMDVGERVRVRLLGTDAERGFVDFAGA